MIREFRRGDEKGIALLEKECFSQPWSENAILESLSNNTFFTVFEEKGIISGYAGLQIVLNEGYITNIAVTKSSRGKGIGKALVDELKNIARLKKLDFITLEVRKSNITAISLYEKSGFKPKGFRKNFYSTPTEDAIIMTLEEF